MTSHWWTGTVPQRTQCVCASEARGHLDLSERKMCYRWFGLGYGGRRCHKLSKFDYGARHGDERFCLKAIADKTEHMLLLTRRRTGAVATPSATCLPCLSRHLRDGCIGGRTHQRAVPQRHQPIFHPKAQREHGGRNESPCSSPGTRRLQLMS